MDFAQTEWGKILVQNFKEETEGFINELKSALSKLDNVGAASHAARVACEWVLTR
ncbi:MAG: hypothetical protein FWC53_03425 [Firmicutes bacterium]|nr:hypothetical protein [Bacillota bacterium]